LIRAIITNTLADPLPERVTVIKGEFFCGHTFNYRNGWKFGCKKEKIWRVFLRGRELALKSNRHGSLIGNSPR
jgi:hypothetical protein